MHAIEVQRNGVTVCVVGASNAVMFSVHVGLTVEGPAAATLDAMGMNDLGNDRQSHTSWLEELVLGTGDVISLRFANVPRVTPPVREVAADLEEHLAEQQWYEQQVRDNPFVPNDIPRNRPAANLELAAPNVAPIVATFEGVASSLRFASIGTSGARSVVVSP